MISKDTLAGIVIVTLSLLGISIIVYSSLEESKCLRSHEKVSIEAVATDTDKTSVPPLDTLMPKFKIVTNGNDVQVAFLAHDATNWSVVGYPYPKMEIATNSDGSLRVLVMNSGDADWTEMRSGFTNSTDAQDFVNTIRTMTAQSVIGAAKTELEAKYRVLRSMAEGLKEASTSINKGL